MGNEFQEAIDYDNLEMARKNLNDFTDKLYKKKLYFEKQIIKVDNENLDRVHMAFLQKYPKLNFEEMRIVKKVFDFIKEIL